VPLLPVVASAERPPEHVADRAQEHGLARNPPENCRHRRGVRFLSAGGLISIILECAVVPRFRFSRFRPDAFCLTVGVAGQRRVPFGVFRCFYKFLNDTQKIAFEESLNRLHFMVTIIAVVRQWCGFMAWEQKLVSKMLERYFGPEYLSGFTGLLSERHRSFVINIFKAVPDPVTPSVPFCRWLISSPHKLPRSERGLGVPLIMFEKRMKTASGASKLRSIAGGRSVALQPRNAAM